MQVKKLIKIPELKQSKSLHEIWVPGAHLKANENIMPLSFSGELGWQQRRMISSHCQMSFR